MISWHRENFSEAGKFFSKGYISLSRNISVFFCRTDGSAMIYTSLFPNAGKFGAISIILEAVVRELDPDGLATDDAVPCDEDVGVPCEGHPRLRLQVQHTIRRPAALLAYRGQLHEQASDDAACFLSAASDLKHRSSAPRSRRSPT